MTDSNMRFRVGSIHEPKMYPYAPHYQLTQMKIASLKWAMVRGSIAKCMSISNPNSHMNFEEDEVKQSLKRPAQEDYFPNIYIYIIRIYIYIYIILLSFHMYTSALLPCMFWMVDEYYVQTQSRYYNLLL